MIVSPPPNVVLPTTNVTVSGWAWSVDGIESVHVGHGEPKTWIRASLETRSDFSWQKFSVTLSLPDGPHDLVACATSLSGIKQPMEGRRNHVHSVKITVDSSHKNV